MLQKAQKVSTDKKISLTFKMTFLLSEQAVHTKNWCFWTTFYVLKFGYIKVLK